LQKKNTTAENGHMLCIVALLAYMLSFISKQVGIAEILSLLLFEKPGNTKKFTLFSLLPAAVLHSLIIDYFMADS
jgi:hypothetical protein